MHPLTAPLTPEAINAAINQMEASRTEFDRLAQEASKTEEDFQEFQEFLKAMNRPQAPVGPIRYVENRAECRKREQAERRAVR